MTKQYRVLIGMNYGPEAKRAEVGEVVNDIPAGSVPWLLDAHAIEPFPEGGSVEAPAETATAVGTADTEDPSSEEASG